MLTVAVTSAGDVPAAAEDRALPSIPFELCYKGKLISGRFDNISLGQVLDALVRKAGLRVSLTDPTIATWSVSAELPPSRLEHAVTEILQSYREPGAGGDGAIPGEESESRISTRILVAAY